MPHFLNEAALDFPDTALKAIARETAHLYENVFAYIAVGLGLSEDDLRTEKPMTEGRLGGQASGGRRP